MHSSGSHGSPSGRHGPLRSKGSGSPAPLGNGWGVVAEAVIGGELEDIERQLPDDEGYEQPFEITEEEEYLA